MAAPSYTTDLTTINDGSGTFTEPAGALLGSLSNGDTDNFIQATSCSSKSTGASGAPALAGIGIQAGTAQTITSPNAYYAWVFVGGGGLIDTLANGGIRLIVGQDINNYRFWYADGSDFFPYIGWQCIAIETDNAVVAATGSQGTPSATKQYFGAVFNCKINISKGNPMALDAIRWGRTITVTLGEASNYAVFSGIATENDSINNRWGQFQVIPGGFQLQGKLLLGVTGGNAVDFRDANKNIVIAISRKTAASFNAIEIQNASSRVDWTSCNFSALGTVSRGTVTVTDNATVNIIGCSFTDMSTFSFLSNTTVTSCVFRRTDTITKGASIMTNCVIDNSRATTAILASSPANAALITGCTFTSDGTGYAIEITGAAAEFTLTGNTFTGYASSNGSTGNEAIFVNIGTGTVTINISGGTTPSIRTAGATVVVNATITLTLTGLITGSDIVILNAGTSTERVNVDANSGTTYGYGYTDSGSYIDVGVFLAGYVPFYVRNYLLASSAASLPIAQVIDRNYLQ